MALVIQPYLAEHEAAVEEFNQRLQRGVDDRNMVFYRYAEPRWLPKSAGGKVYQEYFVAVDGGVVRGGYALKIQDFLFPDGEVRSIGYYHHPLSEGIVDNAYNAVGGLLLRDAMMRAPLLYCLGMAGYDRPLPKMLMRLGWTHFLVPFYFRVIRPARFLRQMQTLRGSATKRLLMDAAAITGAAWLGKKAFDAYCGIRAPRGSAYAVTEVAEFGDWADALWNEAMTTCSHTAVRDATTLRTLYPPSQTHLTRLRVSRDGKDVGWAVIGERRRDEKYGDMRVGSIVDGWALPGEHFAVVRAATQKLEEQNFDLALTNQSHVEWCSVLKAAGYFSGPSNFIYAASKKLAALLAPFEEARPRLHFTRADGDGLPGNF
jgi:hypothetical protein